jgi:hypothetical protein
MNPVSGSDKRRAGRKSHDSVLELFSLDGQRLAGIGRLVNVSTVGLSFTSTKSFEVGDRVEGRLRLLKEGMLDISGRIVWARRKTNMRQYGVAFDRVRPTAKETM